MKTSIQSQRMVIYFAAGILLLTAIVFCTPSATRTTALLSESEKSPLVTQVESEKKEWSTADIWKELTRRRNSHWRGGISYPSNSPQKALVEETEFEFIDTPLEDALEYLSEYHNITIVLDEAALTKAKISSATPINYVVTEVKLNEALTTILKPLNLKYFIEDKMIKVTVIP